MTSEDILKHCGRITYKDNDRLSFELVRGEMEVSASVITRRQQLKIVVVKRVNNSRSTSGDIVEIASHQFIEAAFIRNPEHLLELVRHFIHKIEKHEADEWLKVDGEIIFDPHKGEANG